MTDKEIIITIAEFEGWEWRKGGHPSPCWHRGAGYTNAPLFEENRLKEDHLEDLPNYLGDLNATARAVSFLDSTQYQKFYRQLIQVSTADCYHHSSMAWNRMVMEAPPHHRAEALALVIKQEADK